MEEPSHLAPTASVTPTEEAAPSLPDQQASDQTEQERRRRLREAAKLLALGALRAHHTAGPIAPAEKAPPVDREQEEVPAPPTT